MKTSTVITVAVVGLMVVAILYLTRPGTKEPTHTSSNSLLTGLNGLIGLGKSLLSAPTKEPDLTTSRKEADDAIAMGLPVSSTQGNDLMTPSFLDGTSLVTS